MTQSKKLSPINFSPLNPFSLNFFISVIFSFTTSFLTLLHCLYFSDNVSISPERNLSTRFFAASFAFATFSGSL